MDLVKIIGGGFGFGSLRTVGISQCQCQSQCENCENSEMGSGSIKNDGLTSSPIEL